MGAKNPNLEHFADVLLNGTVAMFRERGELEFSKPPTKELVNIVEYKGKMRADGMEKFNNRPTYVSAINYYLGVTEMNKKKTTGAIIVYVPQDYMAKMMKLLKYPPVDDENEDALLDSCGTLCNIIAGRFKSEILKTGYIDLEMSHFITSRNSLVPGVDFCPSEFDAYTATFFLENQKKMVIEFSMGIVPKKA